jgi:hypothetical protein
VSCVRKTNGVILEFKKEIYLPKIALPPVVPLILNALLPNLRRSLET